MPEHDLAGPLEHELDERVVHPLLDEHALGRDAHLAGEVGGALDGRRGGCCQVGVGQHDLRAVARRLDQRALHARGADDRLAGAVRADEPDRVDARMRHERLARLPGAVHHADGAGREAGLLEDLDQALRPRAA